MCVCCVGKEKRVGKCGKSYKATLYSFSGAKGTEIILCRHHDIELFKEGETRFLKKHLRLVESIFSGPTIEGHNYNTLDFKIGNW